MFRTHSPDDVDSLFHPSPPHYYGVVVISSHPQTRDGPQNESDKIPDSGRRAKGLVPLIQLGDRIRYLRTEHPHEHPTVDFSVIACGYRALVTLQSR